MSQAIVKIDPKYLEIVRTSLTNNGLPKPFVQEVELLDCNVAGTTFLDLDDIEPKLKKHQLLMLQRELKNEYDNNAILIVTSRHPSASIILHFYPVEHSQAFALLPLKLKLHYYHTYYLVHALA